MAINKKLIHFNKKATFNSQKLSANDANTQYQVGGTGNVQTGAPDINYQSIIYIKDSKEIWTHGQFYGSAASVAWSAITGKPSFATVATSGSYTDLTNKPTIPTSLPTPNSLTFTGATTGTWNGSSAKTVNIPTYSLPTASASILGGVKVGSGLSISNGVLSTSGGDVKIYETTINFEDIITNSRTEMTSSERNEVLNISNKIHQGYVIVVPTTTSGMNMVGGAVPVVDNAPSYSFLFCGGTTHLYIVTADLDDSGDTWDIRQISENIIQSGTIRVYCRNNSITLESYGAHNTLYSNSGMTSLGKYNADSTVNTGMTRLVSIGTGTSNNNRISGLEVGQYKSNSFVALCDKTSDGCYMTMNGNTGEVHLTGYNCEMVMDTSGMQISGGADLYIDMNPRFLGGAVEIGNDSLSVGLIQYGDFNITGDITCTGAATFSSTVAAEGGFFDTSDARVKTNVRELNAINADAIKLVEFDRTDTEHHGYGVIAQEVEEVYPSVVNTDANGFKSVNYNEIAMIKIKYLEDKVARLEALVARLESKLS